MLDKILNPGSMLESDAGVGEALVSAYHIYVMNHPRYPHELAWKNRYDTGELADKVQARRKQSGLPLNGIVSVATSIHHAPYPGRERVYGGWVSLHAYRRPTDQSVYALLHVNRCYYLINPKTKKPWMKLDVTTPFASAASEIRLDINHELASTPSVNEQARIFGDLTLDLMNGKRADLKIQPQPGFKLHHPKQGKQ